MTSFQSVYDAFLGKILDDEWQYWEESEYKEDWKTILKGALPNFKFPRVSLETEIDSQTNEEYFIDDLNNEEIQILATYMKCEWLNRTILTWENIKPLYEERDFSQANLLNSFYQSLKDENQRAEKLESKYYRSIKNKPFNYSKLATQMKNV